MPKIPDYTALGQRPTPDSGRPVYRPPTDNSGEVLSQFGGNVQQIGSEMKQNVDRFNYAKAKADYLTKSLDIETQFQNDTDYKTLPQRYQAAQQSIASSVIAALPDEKQKAELSVDLQSDMARQNFSMRQRANGLWKEDETGQAVTQVDALKKAYIQTGDAKYVSAVHDRWAGMKAAGIINAAEADQKILSDATEMTKGRLDVMPRNFRIDLKNRFSQPVDSSKYSTSDAAVKFVVDKLEDDGKGTVTIDGGGVTKYGVSQKANPDVDVANLTKEGAYKIMKERYWDKAGIDQMPDNMKLIAFDAAVNQGVPKAIQMAALSGNDPVKFLNLRRQAYQQTVQDDPSQMKNLVGWNNRLDKLTGTATTYTKAGDIFDNLPADYLMQVSERAVTENHTAMLQELRGTMRFADAATKAKTKLEYQNDSSVVNVIEETEKQLKEDPAGYAAQSPNLSQAHTVMEQAKTPEARDMYFDQLKNEQMRMGVPEQSVKYAPKSMIDDFKSTITSENANPDQVINKINDIKNIFGEKYGHVLGEIRDAGITGPYAVAADLAGSGNVRDLVEAAMYGKEKLTKTIPNQADAKGLSDAVDSKLEDFTAAQNATPNGVKISADYKDAVELLALRNMSDGMAQKPAVEKAVKAIVPYQVDGSLILPNGIDMSAVKTASEDYKSKLANMNIVLPPELGDTKNPRRDVYLNMIKNVKPVVQGDQILFYWPNRNPVLDKDKVRYFPGTTKVQNAGEAAVKLPISAAISGTDSISSPQLQDAIVSDRAALTLGINRDINDFYKPGAKLEGISHSSATVFVKGKNGYDSPQPISQALYNSLSDADKTAAKQKIIDNVKYNQMVMARLPDSQKETFKRYIERSNSTSENYHFVNSTIPQTWDGGMSGREVANLRKKANEMAYIRSVGFNYLEVPEWAKGNNDGNDSGMITKGNIDLNNRPVVDNPEGGKSTVYSTSFEENGKEILVPRVSPDGKILSEKQAIDLYHSTGKHLGIFKTSDAATAYAKKLHEDQAKRYGLSK